MLSRGCVQFRRGFVRGAKDAHARICPECRLWAESVAALAGCGANFPLPGSLHARLTAVPRPSGEGAQNSPDGPCGRPPLGPLPQIPLPAFLAARLQRIPAREADRPLPPLWITRPRTTLAASYLLALLLMVALSSPNVFGKKTSRFLSRGVDLTVREAGAFGPRALLDTGASLFKACTLANRALDALLDRLSPGPATACAPVPSAPHRKDVPSPAPPPNRKENHHGTRPAR